MLCACYQPNPLPNKRFYLQYIRFIYISYCSSCNSQTTTACPLRRPDTVSRVDSQYYTVYSPITSITSPTPAARLLHKNYIQTQIHYQLQWLIFSAVLTDSYASSHTYTYVLFWCAPKAGKWKCRRWRWAYREKQQGSAILHPGIFAYQVKWG